MYFLISFFISTLLFLYSVVPAQADKPWQCFNEGEVNGKYYQPSGFDEGQCATDEICDDNYEDTAHNNIPCAKFSALQCKCTGSFSFSCGVNSNTEFPRGCGQGQICDMSVFKAGSHWPCSTDPNATNAPTGSTYDPCPNQVCDTALGAISTTDPGVFIGTLFKTILGLAGGVALLLIIISGYQLSVSQGNPEKVKNARERLVSAVIGLMFIIFSVAILQIIGVNILALPGFKP